MVCLGRNPNDWLNRNYVNVLNLATLISLHFLSFSSHLFEIVFESWVMIRERSILTLDSSFLYAINNLKLEYKVLLSLTS